MTMPSFVAGGLCATGLSLALLGTATTLTAQSQQPEDLLWLNRSRTLGAIDAFGETTSRNIPAPQPSAQVHRAPDGRIWLSAGSRAPSEIYNRDGTLSRRIQTPSGIHDVAFGAGNEVFTIGVLPGSLDRWIRIGLPFQDGRQFVPGTPLALAIDGLGAVFVVSANQPRPFLTRRDPTSGALSTVTLPAGGVGSADVLGLPQGGCRVVVESPNRSTSIFDVGSDLRVIRSVDIPSFTGIEQMEQTADGTTWLAGRNGLFRLPAGSQRPLLVLPLQFTVSRRVTIDPMGSLWSGDTVEIWRIDGRTGALDDRRVENGVPETSDRYVRAWTIAPFEDDDGDGARNGTEIQLGTNPYDDQSSPVAHLEIARITYRAEERAVFELSGLGGAGALLFAGGYDLNQRAIPGLLGDPRLDLASLAPIGAPMSVPGRLVLQVPDDPNISNALLCAQALVGVAQPTFTNHDCARTSSLSTVTITDTFAQDTRLQTDRSSARLLPGGFLTTGPIGGTGIHGRFDFGDGLDLGSGIYEFSTDEQRIPAERTLFGDEVVVRNGRFEFTDFEVPAGITVRFVGSRPAVIRVAGEARILGVLDLNGGDLEESAHDGKNSTLVGGVFTPGEGQRGSSAGAGGGQGGNGAFACDGSGNPMQPQFNDFDGYDGEDLRVPAGHAYAGMTAGTGGSGAALYPPVGDSSVLIYRGFGNTFCINSASGGSGGGFQGLGADGRVVQGPSLIGGPPASPNEFGAPTPGGSAIPDLDPRPTGSPSLEHYLVPGSGGGGGASHPLFIQRSDFSDPFKFLSGAAGTGGGGAVALRVGSDLAVGSQGRIQARGGDGARTASNATVRSLGVPAPGGGGSGGSVLLQVAEANTLQNGQIVVRGGQGGSVSLSGPFYFCDVQGGDGAAGSARLEVLDPNVQPGAIGQVEPASAASVGTLTDRDARTIAILGPYVAQPSNLQLVRWRHYEIRAVVDGNPVTFTDANTGFRPANVAGSPVRAWFRAANRTGPARSAWRDFVNPDAGPSVSGDLATQIEVLLVFDRSIARDIRIDSLELKHWR